ncbi:hypothetical protein PC116_g16537 [Phytophthora cactorum]|nr:hypothetical protein PC112_g18205 [Phytophthora cactorum]KAG2813642.1 hypothetical protein PC111_g14306 [Phytophthora cactorum]KAG2854459.1 hypothetical protein PC113_g13286 [Phytophthora cactorum]KAG3002259.1 hypothetical protein PC119_g16397 [Phytophthora cactorum]KAG3072006.1 hypothetical protein PC122_g15429 [Phytophthora cactorum]
MQWPRASTERDIMESICSWTTGIILPRVVQEADVCMLPHVQISTTLIFVARGSNRSWLKRKTLMLLLIYGAIAPKRKSRVCKLIAGV